MFKSSGHVFAITCTLCLCACGGSSTAPTPNRASLVFTATPNPVPSSGLGTSCVGTLAKTWVWIWNIRNTGNATFTVASFQNTYQVPGAAPIVIQGTANDFIALYGTSVIAPNASAQATVCIGLTNPPAATVTHTSVLVGQSGDSFNTPTVQLLP
jgi:hypothetical protein